MRLATALLAACGLLASLPALAQSQGRLGREVYESVCIACHAAGNVMVSSPKLGDSKEWQQRIQEGGKVGLDDFSESLAKEVDEASSKLIETNSPYQLQRVAFEAKMLPVQQKDKPDFLVTFPQSDDEQIQPGQLSTLNLSFEPRPSPPPRTEEIVPDVRGNTELVARRLLGQKGFQVEVLDQATDKPEEVDRVIDQFPTDRQAQIRIMLSESLRGVIAQNLCRKIGGGRIAALEVLMVSQGVSNLIREGKTFQIPSMMQVGKNIGMVSLNDALMDLVVKKLVAPDEALSKAVDKAGFEALLKRAGAGAGVDARPSPKTVAV